MILQDNEIVLRSAEHTRSGRGAALEELAEQGDAQFLDQKDVERPSGWYETEWKW